MKNKEMAVLFSKIADALEIKGETGFKVVAYRKASRILEDMTEDIATLADQKKLEDLPGIGSGIAKKIDEYLQTGHMKKLDEALSGIPEGLLMLLDIQNLGARTVHLMHEELGVENLQDLKRVISDGTLAQLYGLGEKKVENIRQGVEIYEQAQERIPIDTAFNVVGEVIAYLKKAPRIGRISPAGSLRRMRETVGDIDILATGSEGLKIIDHFARFPGVDRVLAAGKTKGSVMIRTPTGSRQVDLRIVDDSEYGAALQYFTGSKAHNIKLRSLAKEKGMKISEYGVFKGEKRVAGYDELEVYRILGLPLIPSEMREDRGEVELALQGKLPEILDYEDIRGDLHVHSNDSDGSLTLEDLVVAAEEMGYDYIAVCDHSQAARYANGLTPDRLEQQVKDIDKLNKKIKGIRVLKGTEVDILPDGRLDFPGALLKKLDFVVASVHSGFKKNVTERILRAMANPLVDVIAHPSGRLISRRQGYEVDLERVIDGAARTGAALELNAYYDRLDLNEFDLKRAKEKGVKISLGTDTHHPGGMAMMRFGTGIARRAWLEKEDILNSMTLDELLHFLKRRRLRCRSA